MTRWLLGGAFVAVATLTSMPRARADDACWHLVFAAIRHSAEAPRPQYISYSENVDITANTNPFLYYNIDVVYRTDGIAYVEDSRWAQAFVTHDLLEPGPPVLGPYGSARYGWLPAGVLGGRLQTIASVENFPKLPCTDEGDETIDGVRYAHLVTGVADKRRPALKEIWIDRQSLAIPRLIVSGVLLYENFYGHGLADYQVDMQNVGGYAVVRTVRWTSLVRSYHQTTKLDAVFTFGNYRFTAEDRIRRELMQSSQSTFSSPRPRL
ncbi:MAG TPA: hypothetical protein VMB20_00805 [Candidatus Acidoferrum sp.]|nr:hypothetical protein [Candidatus Acidoferrum sp.]